MALSDKELEKIKLMQQFRSGERTDLPDVDSDTYKLSKIKAFSKREIILSGANRLQKIPIDFC